MPNFEEPKTSNGLPESATNFCPPVSHYINLEEEKMGDSRPSRYIYTDKLPGEHYNQTLTNNHDMDLHISLDDDVSIMFI